MKFLPIFVTFCIFGSPAHAVTYNLGWQGKVTSVDGTSSGSEIKIGDDIAAEFSIDFSELSAPTVLALGGGTYTIYDSVIHDFSVKMASYTTTKSSTTGYLTFMDNSWGSDAISIGIVGLEGGPFRSSFLNLEFQGRGPTNLIDNTGSNNGLPLNKFNLSLFAIFGDGTSSERVFGNLELMNKSRVPEPNVWSTFIAGFAAIGIYLRRKAGKALSNA